MAKQTTQQPALQQASEAAPETNVIQLAGKGGKAGFWATEDDDVQKKLSRRAELLGSATQKLAMAADYFNEGAGKKADAEEAAADATLLLYQGRVEGVLDADLVSAELGRIFGFKMVKDKNAPGGEKPGKTPAGQGEAVRKRVVRLFNAHEFIENGQGGTFFSEMNADDVADVVHDMENGGRSIWTAYDDLQKLKSQGNNRVELAFDPVRIAKLAASLGANVGKSADLIKGSPNLKAAYKSLLNILGVIGEQAAA